MYFLKYLFYFNFKINLLYRCRIFFEISFLSFYNNSILLYCANFYGRCFIRVYEDKMPVIKVCTVQQNTIILVIVSTIVSRDVSVSLLSTYIVVPLIVDTPVEVVEKQTEPPHFLPL